MPILLFRTISAPAEKVPTLEKTLSKVIAKKDNLILRQQTFFDLQDTRLTLMNAEGWPSLKHALEATYSIDPVGFYMLEYKGKKVGSISVVTYPYLRFAYVGFYVVAKEARGQGYGKFIFDTAVKYSMQQRGVRCIGLNCLEDMVPMYQNWGFKAHTIDSIWRYTATANLIPPANAVQSFEDMPPEVFNTLVDYDAAVFGESRTEFLQNFINKPNTTTVVIKEDNNIQGYGIISERVPATPEPNTSYRIGPLYANNVTVASRLLDALIVASKLKENECIFLESPGTNNAVAPLLMQFGFKHTAQMRKMYNAAPPPHDENKIFCYCSLATGG